MRSFFSYLSWVLLVAGLVMVNTAGAQTEEKGKEEKHKRGAIYASWGYNHEWFTRSTVHVSQAELGNNYDMIQVNARDHEGWNEKNLLSIPLTIPQYNYRIGYYFNEKQDMGIELNFDHTKYLIRDNQNIHVKGTYGGKAIDSTVLFSEQAGFYYFLNNGANFFLLNFVKRFGIYHRANNNFNLDLNCKAGVGPVIPHVENKLFGLMNQQGFQFGGWNTGIETALRATLWRYAFIEYSQKVDYARYSDLKVASGTAKQNFGTYELILSVGVILPTTKHHPMFENRKKHSDSQK